jgi:hypothetical protein
MSLAAAELEAFLEAQSALLRLPIAPEHRQGVLRYLQLAADMATRVMELPLDRADESGSVFVPVTPARRGEGVAT